MKFLVPVAFALVLVLVGPGHAGEPITPAGAALVKGNNAFALDLYGRVRAESGNLFLSPYSVSAALGMTREGAAGATRAQMDAVLHLPSEGTAQAFHDLVRALEPPLVRDGYGRDAKEVPAYELEIANRLFGQQGFAFLPDFVNTLNKNFGAGLAQVDFRESEAARGVINGWIEEQTNERIQNILPPGSLAVDTRLVLANAIYFKAAWADPFRERGTQPGPFTTGAGTEVEVPLMRRTGRYAYGARDGVQALVMPYRGRATAMVVLLPRAKDGLPALEAGLDGSWLEWIGSDLQTARVAVTFPKFEFTKRYDLTRELPALGMTDAFDATKADFTGMTREEPLFIGLVLHKAFVKVDEAGTEAAAATVVGMRAGSAARPDEPVAFTADRPFLFLIMDRATNSILFMGRVSDPSN